jgi:transcriptional regulator with PAS, ATPase and Fis domain
MVERHAIEKIQILNSLKNNNNINEVAIELSMSLLTLKRKIKQLKIFIENEEKTS